MSWNNKVIWTEGMFLRPTHFQQQERHFQHWIEARCAALQCYAWGVIHLEIDQALLTLGKFAVTSCQGVFPDGTPFSIPDHDPAPIPLELSTDTKNRIVYLALPVSRITGKEVSRGTDNDELSRYRMREIEIKDIQSPSSQESVTLESGEIWTRLLLAGHNKGAFLTIPIAKVNEIKADKQVVLDTQFIPTSLHSGAVDQLSSYIREIEGILQHRGAALAQRLGSPGAGGAAEIVDFLFLQIVNRYQPLLTHFASVRQLHPESLYSTLLQMAGELATITKPEHRPATFPVYCHDDLTACFPPVVIALREALSWVSESRAIPIPLEEHPHQIRTAIIADRKLLQSAEFILAVNAQIPTDKLLNLLPRQTTITTVEKLRDFVMAQVPGIRLVALAVAPRQLPYHKGMTYFGLDKNTALWQELEKSGTIAMHFSGEYPGLELEFWAIRG
ncbi:MAG: type VI secretion system baseplate subunit TssK [Methylococcales bacterium]